MRGIVGANQLVEQKLNALLGEMEKCVDADCLTYVGAIAYGADDFIRDAVENIKNKKKKLLFVLESHGGFAETARRISDVLRFHYEVVDFLVPSHAMSAGTILVMSGDAIHMDYYSVLGPIDPQVEGGTDKSRLIPALGFLVKYQELLDKANAGTITTAEMNILMNFNQGELYSYEQARDLSRVLLEEWLAKYKFKNWVETESRKLAVTDAMRKVRAREIADALNDVKRWNSHGIGINMETLRRELRLVIDDFGLNQKLNGAVRPYNRLLVDYMGKMGQLSAVHTRETYLPLLGWHG